MLYVYESLPWLLPIAVFLVQAGLMVIQAAAVRKPISLGIPLAP